MIIDSKGFELDTLEDILESVTDKLRAKYGDDFYIKPEGVIDNIFESSGFQELSLQEQIAFLCKQFDPETAEGKWQDALYERMGVYRIEAEKTVIERTIQGTAGIQIDAETITIRNKQTLEEFFNKDVVTIGEDGSIVADFESVLYGAIEFPKETEIEILSAPLGVNNVIAGDNPRIDLGRERETDEEFRIRFRKEKSKNAKATRNANYANLLPYVDDESYIDIKDKKTDVTMDAGTIRIIANHNTTDTIFATAIFETVADGIDTLGTKTVVVKDNANQDVSISWINATFIEISIKASIKKKDGVFWESLKISINEAISHYLLNNIYGLGQTVYAIDFIPAISSVEGVETITSIQVGINDSSSYADSVIIENTALAAFNTEWNVFNEA